jgi:iron(III) transport system permease protein
MQEVMQPKEEKEKRKDTRLSFLSGDRFPLILSLIYISLVLIPIIEVLYQSFTFLAFGQPPGLSFQNYVTAITAPPGLGSIFLNSITYSVGAALLGTSIGMGLAWIVARTNTPGKWFIQFLPLYSILVPDVARIGSWVLLLTPKSGVLNNLLHTNIFNAYSIPSMIFVFSIFSVTLSYLITLPAFLNLDSSLEESALICGAGPLTTSARITFPVLLPAFLAAFIFSLVRALVSFATPTLLGTPARIYTFTSAIYGAYSNKLNPGLATAYSTFLVIGTILLVLLYLRVVRVSRKYASLRSKGYKNKLVLDLGRWKYVTLSLSVVFFAIAMLLPTIVMIIVSFTPFYSFSNFINFMKIGTLQSYHTVLTDPFFIAGLYNSIYLSIAAAIICTLVAALIIFTIRRTRSDAAKILDVIGTMPLAFPDIIISLGILLFFISSILFETTWLILLIFVIIYVPFTIRSISSNLINVDKDLEDVASVHGARWTSVIRRVTLPLLKRTLLASFVIVFLLALQNIDATVLLSAPSAQYGSVAIFFFFREGLWSIGSAGALIYLGILLVSIILATKVFKIRLSL